MIALRNVHAFLQPAKSDSRVKVGAVFAKATKPGVNGGTRGEGLLSFLYIIKQAPRFWRREVSTRPALNSFVPQVPQFDVVTDERSNGGRVFGQAIGLRQTAESAHPLPARERYTLEKPS
jgi:hypothetical protein